MMTVALGPVLSRAEDPQATGGARARVGCRGHVACSVMRIGQR